MYTRDGNPDIEKIFDNFTVNVKRRQYGLGNLSHYIADVKSATDYYPFGMQMPGRKFNGGDYRYGFNSMENDNEIKGEGNSVDFGARMYDPRLGRWQALDPLAAKYPSLSPYNFVANSPLIFIDPDGKKVVFAKNSTEEYKKKAVAQMQKLTNHKLVLKGNEVVIAKHSGANAGKKLKMGTKLVEEIISSKYTATIGEVTDGHNGVDHVDGVNHEPGDVVISYDVNKSVHFTDENGKEYGTLTRDENGNLQKEVSTSATQIGLAHEFLHATRMMGDQPGDGGDYDQKTTDNLVKNITNPDLEEPLSERSGQSKKITNEEMLTRTQENVIREEQGLNKRNLGPSNRFKTRETQETSKKLFMKN